MPLDPAWFIGPAALLVALAIDRWWGEPRVRLHPVVWMGNYLAWGGQLVQRVAGQGSAFTHRGQVGSQVDFKAFWLAAGVWIAGGSVFLIASLALQRGVLAVPGVLMPVLGMLARRLGVRRSLLLGSFIYSLGFFLTNWTIQVKAHIIT